MPVIKNYRNLRHRNCVYDPMLKEIKKEITHGPGASNNRTAKLIAGFGIFITIAGTILLSGMIN